MPQFAKYSGKSMECMQQYGGYTADVSCKKCRSFVLMVYSSARSTNELSAQSQ